MSWADRSAPRTSKNRRRVAAFRPVRGPHQPTGVVIDHARQVPVALPDDMRVILTVGPPPFAGAGPRERRTPLVRDDSGLMKTMSGNQLRAVTLGHPLLDDYLEFVAARARPNTLIAVAYDLKVFFTEVVKQPADVTTADVLRFIKSQRAPRRGAGVVRLEDGEAGLSARTIKRRLASVSGLFDYLVARGDAGVNDQSGASRVWPPADDAAGPGCGASP